MKVSKKARVLVIGIDGAPYTLLKSYAESGVMPNLAALLPSGSLRQMDVPVPEVSSVSWTSFFTGVNPGKHGIYGFVDLEPSSRRVYFPNLEHVKAPPLWDRLTRAGKTSIIVNVPGSYPAPPLRGALISGFVAPELARATYPRILLPELRKMGYQLDVDAGLAHEGRLEDFLEELHRVLDLRVALFDRLWNRFPWDLFVATITGSDRLQHFLWEAEADSSHKFHNDFRDFYRKVDRILGKLCSRLEADDTLLIVSDHGFTEIKSEVYTNQWLLEEGLLGWKGEERGLEHLDPDSRAFALDPGRIYLNTRERCGAGATRGAAEARGAIEEILRKIQELRIAPDQSALADQGIPVIQEVLRGENVYSGPLVARAPELILLSRRGFDLKATLQRNEIFGRSSYTGMHTRDDAVFFINRKDIREKRPHMVDVAPTILELLGLPLSAELDGVGLVEG